jgi:putative ABC transport system permease protein
LDTYRLHLQEGRFFERERSTDRAAVILNEAAVKALAIENPLEKRIILTIPKKIPMNIIGVFENFHLQPLHYPIGPMAAMLKSQRPGVLLSVRLQKGKIEEGLSAIRKAWNEFLPGQPLEHVFFDDQIHQSYLSEIQDGKVMTAFASLAILIATLGLFGLASFTTSQRTKEIGIRKVMGASAPRIAFLLSKQFIKWVLIANLIAWPVAYYAMGKWLQNFAYRIEVHIWVFVVSAAAALMIALLTVSYQTVKAACVNPVNSLRYE